MHDALAQTLPFVALAFLASAMFSLGLDLTVRQIVDPLRDRRLLASALVANVVIVPLIAIVVTRLMPMAPAMQVGIILYALSAGTETGPKFVQIAKGNAGLAVGLLALLVAISVVFLPPVLSLAVPGVHVDRGQLLAKLVVAVAVPMGLGVFLRSRRAAIAERIRVVMHRGSLVLLCVFVVQVISVNYAAMLAVESGAIIGGLLFFALAFVTGYFAGGQRAENRRALAIMTFIRNAPLSMATASQVFVHDPGVVVMVTVMSAASLVVGVLATAMLSRSAA